MQFTHNFSVGKPTPGVSAAVMPDLWMWQVGPCSVRERVASTQEDYLLESWLVSPLHLPIHHSILCTPYFFIAISKRFFSFFMPRRNAADVSEHSSC